MKNTNIKILAIVFVVINIVSIFFKWVELRVIANVDTIIFSSSFSVFTETVKGITLPGGVLGIILPIFLLFLIFKGTKYAVLFGIAIFVNGVGHALGWFFDKKEYLNIDVLKEYASAIINVVPQTSLFIYIFTGLILLILPLFMKKNY